jgi:hypothetical protein
MITVGLELVLQELKRKEWTGQVLMILMFPHILLLEERLNSQIAKRTRKCNMMESVDQDHIMPNMQTMPQFSLLVQDLIQVLEAKII